MVATSRSSSGPPRSARWPGRTSSARRVSAARLIGIPDLAGCFLFSLAGFLLAWLVVTGLLRPDPLLTARALEATQHEELAQRHTAGLAEGTTTGPAPEAPNHDGSMRRGISVIRANTRALRAVLVMGLGHLVMVSVMVMTPIHMKHGHAELEVIGFVISIHILGMYVLSPVVGAAVDRWGGRVIAMIGGVILAIASVLAALSEAGWSALLLVALFLLGVGWSCTLVSGSTTADGGSRNGRAAGDARTRRCLHGAGWSRRWRGGRSRRGVARLRVARRGLCGRRRGHPRDRGCHVSREVPRRLSR